MMIGTPAVSRSLRSRRHTSSPPRPGSIRSSTMRSGRRAFTSRRASGPFAAVRQLKPSRSRCSTTSPRMSGSSSTTRISWRIAPRAGAGALAASPLTAAGAEVGVIALCARPGVVPIGEHGDPGGLGRAGLTEELPVVGEHVHLFLDPVVLAGLAAPEHAHLPETVVGVQVGADRHLLAPDVLHGLRPGDAGVRDQQIDGERAVVRPRVALVAALRELAS